MQHPADLDDAGFSYPVEQEMTGTAYPITSATGGFATEEEMIGSAAVGDVGPFGAEVASSADVARKERFPDLT